MLKSLRNRLILSHALPVLIIVPLIGILITYFLETEVFIPSLSSELKADAVLLSAIVGRQPDVLQNPQLAQSLLDQTNFNPSARVSLLTQEGNVVASTRNVEAGAKIQVGASELAAIRKGNIIISSTYSRSMNADVVEILAPVISSQGAFIGIVRMTYQYDTVVAAFLDLRYLITGVILLGLLLGAVLGSILAVSLSNPIRRVTAAVNELATGVRAEPLQPEGPQEIRILVERVNYLESRLRGLEEARQRLLANLVHELGRPLGALHSAIQALKFGASSDPEFMGELLEGMDEETDQLKRLLDDLAHLHDQVLGSLELDREMIDLNHWLQGLLPTWREAALEKRLHWEQKVPANLPQIYADSHRLAQVLGNLISNAVKFTPVGGSISVTAGSENGEAWVSVNDTGPGIAPEEQELIFNRFYRGGKGRRFPQGMGLGLSIAKELAEAHGGHLEVTSAPGAGSKFTLWIPATERDAVRERQPGG